MNTMHHQTAKVILDSISPEGIRLTTLQLRYWRPVHSELMTHRAFSRNARSSRAVPVSRLMKEMIYVPHMMLNRPGMQSSDDLTIDQRDEAERIWIDLAEHTRTRVKRLQELGVHKQWANRPLEWFGWIDTLVTSTGWANWDTLRIDPAAFPDLYDLAVKMKTVRDASTPILLQPGEWHLPYITPEEHEAAHASDINPKQSEDWFKKLSVARCARLSYEPFDGDPSPERELERYKQLVESRPVHASPAEHQATPDELSYCGDIWEPSDWAKPRLHGNFQGWVQYRKTLPYEAVMDDHRV